MKKKWLLICNIIMMVCIVVNVACLGIFLHEKKSLKVKNATKVENTTATEGADTGADEATLSEKGGAFIVDEGVTFTLTEGAVISGHKNRYGAAIYVFSGGTFILDGGLITRNTGKYGTIYVEDGGTLILNRGEITGNYGQFAFRDEELDDYGIYLENPENLKLGDGTKAYTEKTFTQVEYTDERYSELVHDNPYRLYDYDIHYYVDGTHDSIKYLSVEESVLNYDDAPLNYGKCLGYYLDDQYIESVEEGTELAVNLEKTLTATSNNENVIYLDKSGILNLYTRKATLTKITLTKTGEDVSVSVNASASGDVVIPRKIIENDFPTYDVTIINSSNSNTGVTNLMMPETITTITNLTNLKALKSIFIRKNVVNLGDVLTNCPNLENISIHEDNPKYNSRFTLSTDVFAVDEEGNYVTEFVYESVFDAEGNKIDTDDVFDENGYIKYDGDVYDSTGNILDKNIKYDKTIERNVYKQLDKVYEANAIIETETNIILIGCKNSFNKSCYDDIASIQDETSAGIKTATASDTVTNEGICIIPAYINEIAPYAFYKSQIRSILINDENDSDDTNDGIQIGIGAFEGCSSLENFSCQSTINTINSSVFKDCVLLENIKLSSSITEIGSHAFSGCVSLNVEDIKETLLSRNIEIIGEEGFSGCTTLENVDLSASNVTTIGKNAFLNCVNISEISIPSSVTTVGTTPFNGCTGLVNIRIDSTAFPLFNKSDFGGCSKLENLITVTNIKSSGCLGLTNLKTVEIKMSSDIEIPFRAFYNCSNLKTITTDSNIISAGANAFSGTSISNITIDDSTTKTSNEENGLIIKPNKADAYVGAFGGHDLETLYININYNIPIDAFKALTIRHVCDDECVDNCDEKGSITINNCGAIESNAFKNIECENFIINNCRNIIGYSIGNYFLKYSAITGTINDLYLNCEYSNIEMDSITANIINLHIGDFERWCNTDFVCRDTNEYDDIYGFTPMYYAKNIYLGSNQSATTIFTHPTNVVKPHTYQGPAIISVVLPDGVTNIKAAAFECCNLEDIVFMNPNKIVEFGSASDYNVTYSCCSNKVVLTITNDTGFEYRCCNCNTLFTNDSNRNTSNSVDKFSDGKLSNSRHHAKIDSDLYTYFDDLGTSFSELRAEQTGDNEYTNNFLNENFNNFCTTAVNLFNQSNTNVSKVYDTTHPYNISTSFFLALTTTSTSSNPTLYSYYASSASISVRTHSKILTAVANLFGYTHIQYLRDKAEDWVTNYSVVNGDNRLFYDGAVYTKNGYLIFPYAYRCAATGGLLVALIVDLANKQVYVWVDNDYNLIRVTNTMEGEEDGYNSLIETYGRCELFEIGDRYYPELQQKYREIEELENKIKNTTDISEVEALKEQIESIKATCDIGGDTGPIAANKVGSPFTLTHSTSYTELIMNNVSSIASIEAVLQTKVPSNSNGYLFTIDEIRSQKFNTGAGGTGNSSSIASIMFSITTNEDYVNLIINNSHIVLPGDKSGYYDIIRINEDGSGILNIDNTVYYVKPRAVANFIWVNEGSQYLEFEYITNIKNVIVEERNSEVSIINLPLNSLEVLMINGTANNTVYLSLEKTIRWYDPYKGDNGTTKYTADKLEYIFISKNALIQQGSLLGAMNPNVKIYTDAFTESNGKRTYYKPSNWSSDWYYTQYRIDNNITQSFELCTAKEFENIVGGFNPEYIKDSSGNITGYNEYLMSSVAMTGTIDIPDSNTFTGVVDNALANDGMFDGVSKLSIGNNIKTIGANAFKGWDGLLRIFIPSTVTTISSSAFSGCSKLIRIYTDASSNKSGWASGWNQGKKVIYNFSESDFDKLICYGTFGLMENYDYITSPLLYKQLFRYHGTETDVIIPSGTQIIDSLAFSGKTTIKRLTLNNSLMYIQDNAFKGLTNLEIVIFGNENKAVDPDDFYGASVGKSAFANCPNLKNVYVNYFDRFVSFKNNAFEGSGTSNNSTDLSTSLTTLNNRLRIYFKQPKKYINNPNCFNPSASIRSNMDVYYNVPYDEFETVLDCEFGVNFAHIVDVDLSPLLFFKFYDFLGLDDDLYPCFSSYNGSQTTLKIPNVFKGILPLSLLKGNLFEGTLTTTIQHLDVGTGVKYISPLAFAFCGKNLKSVYIRKNVEVIRIIHENFLAKTILKNTVDELPVLKKALEILFTINRIVESLEIDVIASPFLCTFNTIQVVEHNQAFLEEYYLNDKHYSMGWDNSLPIECAALTWVGKGIDAVLGYLADLVGADYDGIIDDINSIINNLLSAVLGEDIHIDIMEIVSSGRYGKSPSEYYEYLNTGTWSSFTVSVKNDENIDDNSNVLDDETLCEYIPVKKEEFIKQLINIQ